MRPVEVRVLDPQEEYRRRQSNWAMLALAPVIALAAFAGWKGVALVTSRIADLHPAIDSVIGIAIGLIVFLTISALLVHIRPLRWLYALAVSGAVGYFVYIWVEREADATWGAVAAVPVALIILAGMLNLLSWLKSQ